MSPMSTSRTSEVGNVSDAVRRYGLATLAAIVALWLRQLLSPLLGEGNPYHTLWPAVVFSAWYCGLGPSLLTTSIGLAGVCTGSFRLTIPSPSRTPKLKSLEWSDFSYSPP